MIKRHWLAILAVAAPLLTSALVAYGTFVWNGNAQLSQISSQLGVLSTRLETLNVAQAMATDNLNRRFEERISELDRRVSTLEQSRELRYRAIMDALTEMAQRLSHIEGAISANRR